MAHFANNGKLKLLIIVGTRPEIIRLVAVIGKCRTYFDCLLAHTGQNYDYNLNGVFFRTSSWPIRTSTWRRWAVTWARPWDNRRQAECSTKTGLEDCRCAKEEKRSDA